MHTQRMSRFMVILGLSLAGMALSTAADAAVKVPGNTVENVDFERHVMGLFGRQGCNSGSCHGSFQGKGGFRLSLFGYEPKLDYYGLKDQSARRINMNDAEGSLLLLKSTGQVQHGGAVRFTPESWQHEIIKTWIDQGAKWIPGSGDTDKVTVTPSEQAFTKMGQKVQLKVMAKFKDGTQEDVTAFSDFRVNDDAVAEVSKQGEVVAVGPGTTAVIVTYRSQVMAVQVLSPANLPQGAVFPKTSSVNYIDDIVFERLKKLNMIPADLSTDTEFVRRIYIDTLGRLPSPEEVKTFLNDKSANKRAKLIDRLLDDPMHAALWATKFCDITGNDTVGLEQPQNLKPKRSQMWHEWFKKRIHENMPYHQIVKGILTATSRDGKAPEKWAEQEYKVLDEAIKGYDFSDYAQRDSLDLFWRKQQKVPNELWGEKVAAAFMGVRLECAQCHKHPFDRWSQEEYRSFANIFGQVSFGTSNETKQAITDFNKKLNMDGKKNNNQIAQLKEVFLLAKPAGLMTHPDTGKVLNPRALGGPELDAKPGEDLRAKLFDYLTQPDNPYFAPSFVNRVWGQYLGVGIVHPIDDFSIANPPTNPKLLNALAQDFIKHKYDIKHIERMILNSRVYQLSSKSNETNKLDKNCFSRSYIRPMMAEVVLDVINSALEANENWGPNIKPGIRAIELGPSFVQQPAAQNVLKLWGRPPRTSACDCERSMDPGLPNKLYMMTDPALLAKISAPSGRLGKLLKTKMTDDDILDELVLATLSRFPTATERQAFHGYLQKAANRQSAFADVTWALLNTKEFIFNH